MSVLRSLVSMGLSSVVVFSKITSPSTTLTTPLTTFFDPASFLASSIWEGLNLRVDMARTPVSCPGTKKKLRGFFAAARTC